MILAGRYRLVRRIATGGMGTVHEAFDERLGRRVAAKVLKEEYADDPRAVERFAREATSAARLSHPTIAQVFDSGHDAGQHFIIMELVDGVHLGQILEATGPLDPRRATILAGQVCAALAAAHAAGIVHRDVKPGNVLVDAADRVKVTDFGIAQTLGQASLTGTGSVLGTAHYLSPEQASGHDATPASDVYSAGVLLFHMLTGTVPFTGESPVAVALSHVTQVVPPVDAVAPDVPPRLAAVVTRATAKDPRSRFADAGQMEAELRNALADPAGLPPTAALPLGAAPTRHLESPSPTRSSTRRPWIVATAGVLALAGLLTTAWLALDGTSPGGERTPSSTEQRPQERSPTPPESTTPASPTNTGPVVPADAVGSDAETLEDQLKSRGYEVDKVDIDASAPKDSVVATIPSPGTRLATEQTIVVIASKGEPPRGATQSSVPSDIVGTDAKDAERLLKDQGLKVEKVDIESDRIEETVVTTYPGPGSDADNGTVVLVVSSGE